MRVFVMLTRRGKVRPCCCERGRAPHVRSLLGCRARASEVLGGPPTHGYNRRCWRVRGRPGRCCGALQDIMTAQDIISDQRLQAVAAVEDVHFAENLRWVRIAAVGEEAIIGGWQVRRR